MQKVCEFDQWTVSDYIAKIDAQQIKLPKFQRGVTWNDEKKKTLINSIRRGFPIGSILLSKREPSVGEPEKYLIVDGLQRTTALRQYLENPTKFVGVADLDNSWKDLISWMIKEFSKDLAITESQIDEFLIDFIRRSNLEDLQRIELFQLYESKFGIELGVLGNSEVLKKKTDVFFTDLRNQLKINDVLVPVIVFSGEEGLLPEIFERLNSEGVKLSKYQIYAATWQQKCAVNNPLVSKAIMDFYAKRLEDSSLEIDDVDEQGKPEELTLFDYLTGLGTVLTNKFPMLYEPGWADKIAFQIANLSHGQTVAQMSRLQDCFKKDQNGVILTDNFTAAVIKISEIVNTALRGRLSLRLNNNNSAEFSGHSEFQMATIVTRLLVEEFDTDTWLPIGTPDSSSSRLQMIRRWYLIDRVRKAWGNAGDSQSFRQVWTQNDENVLVPNSVTLTKSTPEELKRALENWFEDEMSRKDRARSSVNRETKLVLRYFYYSKLSVQEEDERTFHLDHLVPVAWWAKFFKVFKEAAGPINSIGNLCLMTTTDNADKKKNLPVTWFSERKQNGDDPLFEQQCVSKYFLVEPSHLEYPGLVGDFEQLSADDQAKLSAVMNGLTATSEKRWHLMLDEIVSMTSN